MASAQKPKRGDLIEISRPGYQHWAIYVGNGYVVHLAPPFAGAGLGSSMSVLADVARVKMEELWDVIGDSFWKINNLLDDEYEPHPVNIILSNANQLVGKKLPYGIASRNCEHFVTQLRYGKAESQQVRQVVNGVVWGGVAVLGVAALAAIFLSRKEDKRKQ